MKALQRLTLPLAVAWNLEIVRASYNILVLNCQCGPAGVFSWCPDSGGALLQKVNRDTFKALTLTVHQQLTNSKAQHEIAHGSLLPASAMHG